MPEAAESAGHASLVSGEFSGPWPQQPDLEGVPGWRRLQDGAPHPEDLRDIVDAVLKLTRPERVLLFGSGARGEMTEDSDIDILVIDEAPGGTPKLKLAIGNALPMGLRWTDGERELDHARSQVVLASRVARLEPPLDTVFVHIGKVDLLRQSAELARDMGFQGKLCIHPEQVGPVNEAFSPAEEEVAQARRYLEAFAEAEAQGSASIQVDGFFIDYPIVEKAQRVIDLAQEIERAAAGEA